MKPEITYKSAGVDYSLIDPFKIKAQKASSQTSIGLLRHGFKELSASRGESAYLVDTGELIIASITECLGTKILITDAYYDLTGNSFYAQIAQDTLAMAINDLITVGATPISCHAYWAAGSNGWFSDAVRTTDLIEGWLKVCSDFNISWGGGETPSLSGVVEQCTIDLASSSVGFIKDRRRLTLDKDLVDGDQIILVSSSGIHANGVTLARKIAETLADGYLTKLDDGSTLGESLLTPTLIYAGYTEKLYSSDIFPKYMSNITGHGWQKIMRSPQNLTYVINKTPNVPLVLDILAKTASLSTYEAYRTLNMGAGYALFVSPGDVERAIELANESGLSAIHAGYVKTGSRKVIIEPLGVEYEGSDFDIRPS